MKSIAIQQNKFNTTFQSLKTVGTITSRCSEKEPALLPAGTQARHERTAEIEPIKTAVLAKLAVFIMLFSFLETLFHEHIV